MRQSWQEEFEKKYNKPKLERITVGFSGIDPQIKAVSSGEIDEEILKRLSDIEIRIDSGKIDGGDDEPEPEPGHFEPSDFSHEDLDGLLGGSSEGHYHLTGDELFKLRDIPAEGVKGDKGDTGDDGFSPVASVSKSGDTATIKIDS